MTKTPSFKLKKDIAPRAVRYASSILLVCASVCVSVFCSSEVAHAVKSSLSLCAKVIIPSVFPFIVLADFLLATVDFGALEPLPSLFEKAFGIRREGAPAFLLGMICGFPLGVKCTAELYESGALSREEAERLIGFSNNTGPAFIVSGIGAALHGDAKYGVLLYVSMLISATAVGVIFKKNSEGYKRVFLPVTKRRRFLVVDSIKAAATGTLNVCAFITFFAPFCNFLRHILGESLVYLCIIPFLEVGSASSILSKTALLTEAQSLALTSFAICFSGLSVHLQALSFLDKTDIRVKKYFLMKLSQGLIAAALTFSFALIAGW